MACGEGDEVGEALESQHIAIMDHLRDGRCKIEEFRHSSALLSQVRRPPRGSGGLFAGSYLPQTSFDTSMTSFSFAHCSSSASVLPSSVEAKPHWGLRHN